MGRCSVAGRWRASAAGGRESARRRAVGTAVSSHPLVLAPHDAIIGATPKKFAKTRPSFSNSTARHWRFDVCRTVRGHARGRAWTHLIVLGLAARVRGSRGRVVQVHAQPVVAPRTNGSNSSSPNRPSQQTSPNSQARTGRSARTLGPSWPRTCRPPSVHVLPQNEVHSTSNPTKNAPNMPPTYLPTDDRVQSAT